MEFKTPEKPVPAAHYEALQNAPKAATKSCQPRALFPPVKMSPMETPVSSPTSKFSFDAEMPQSPPRQSLPVKFVEKLLFAPRKVSKSKSIIRKGGRYSLPASIKFQVSHFFIPLS